MKFSFFKKPLVQPDLSFLGADMHSHLLPGLDDGLKTVEETVAYIKELHNLGIKKFICTPHILHGVHNNSPETILPALEKARKALAAEQVPVTIEAAAEYMIDQEFEQLVNSDDDLLTFGKNYILIEMSYVALSPHLNEVVFNLQMRHLKPILAHPERYSYYHNDFSFYEDLKDRSILFQVNLLSLSGYYGKDTKRTAEKLVHAEMVDFIGTDMHHATHLQATKDYISTKAFYDLVKGIPLLNSSLLTD